MSFVRREAVRCPDCDIRGDLHDAGYRLPEARARIRACGGCGGAAELPAPGPDPYSVDLNPTDAHSARRRRRAEHRATLVVPRAVWRRYFETLRLERLMSEEPA